MAARRFTEPHLQPKEFAFTAGSLAWAAIGSVLASAVAGGAAFAQQGVTVQSLLKQDFAVVSAITSPIGPGLFLQKKDKLFLCFVTETPKSDAIATKYCKPVE